MVAVGEALGEKYSVARVYEPLKPGAFVKVRDAQGASLLAQWLHASPFTAADLAALAREVRSTPANPSVALPVEVVASASGQPFAIYAAMPPPPVAGALSLFEVGADLARRRAVLAQLLRAFATLADDLGRVLGGRAAHGAITLNHIGYTGRDESLRLVLSGFGLDAAARVASRGPALAPTADTAGLVLALHELMQRSGALPWGATAAKWDLLRNCARAGGHPALKSGLALAQQLRELAVEVDEAREPREPSAPPRPASDPPPARSEPPGRPSRIDSLRPRAAETEARPDAGARALARWAHEHREQIAAAVMALAVASLALYGWYTLRYAFL